MAQAWRKRGAEPAGFTGHLVRPGIGWHTARHFAILHLMTPPHDHSNNPLHDVTLERMLTELVTAIGWEKMARRVRIGCFTSDPSLSSSLSNFYGATL